MPGITLLPCRCSCWISCIISKFLVSFVKIQRRLIPPRACIFPPPHSHYTKSCHNINENTEWTLLQGYDRYKTIWWILKPTLGEYPRTEKTTYLPFPCHSRARTGPSAMATSQACITWPLPPPCASAPTPLRCKQAEDTCRGRQTATS
jgi:hypothetical protein